MQRRFHQDGDGYHLIEINPRPGATLDIFDSDDAPLLETHIRASHGETYRLPAFRRQHRAIDRLCGNAGCAFPAVDWPD